MVIKAYVLLGDNEFDKPEDCELVEYWFDPDYVIGYYTTKDVLEDYKIVNLERDSDTRIILVPIKEINNFLSLMGKIKNANILTFNLN